jgi:hypothetical protein
MINDLAPDLAFADWTKNGAETAHKLPTKIREMVRRVSPDQQNRR